MADGGGGVWCGVLWCGCSSGTNAGVERQLKTLLSRRQLGGSCTSRYATPSCQLRCESMYTVMRMRMVMVMTILVMMVMNVVVAEVSRGAPGALRSAQ